MYVKTSKLGAAQIRWLSELALYDFDIVYQMGRSNLVTDALSRRPEVEGKSPNETCSDNCRGIMDTPITIKAEANLKADSHLY